MRNRLLVILISILAVFSDRATASDFSAIGKLPVILNIFILFGAFACLAIAIRLFALVKGGALARGWQLWVVSFITLTAGQIFIVAEKLDFFILGFDMPGLLYLTTVILWFAGLLQTRKVLR
jgi:hypothetical protein